MSLNQVELKLELLAFKKQNKTTKIPQDHAGEQP